MKITTLPHVCALSLLLAARSPSGAAGVTASSLVIEGPASVKENSTANYKATAIFADGSAKVVTTQAEWSASSRYATIKDGVLKTGEVTGNQTITVTATYKKRGVTLTASKSVTIEDGAKATLLSLSIQGPVAVPENSTANYTAMATFSNGVVQNVTSSAAWSENSPYATVKGGVLTTAEVAGNQTVTVTASYTSGGVTKTASQVVTIQDSGGLAGSHAGRFSTYEGTRTCLRCHDQQARAFHQSVHYQWQGDASEAVGLSSTIAGKLGGINDFCIYPNINWLGRLTNTLGQAVDGGCARCHSGLGLKPTETATSEQLENIDCLLCHSAQYRRKLDETGTRFVPDTANMEVSLLQAAVDVTRPTTATCLKCHAYAGGGNNFKRGDLEAAQADATRELDVHMASRERGGAGLSCLSCHPAVAHKIAGRGTDLREREVLTPVSCTNCHQARPHGVPDLDKHTARVNCTVCHIPVFAKAAPTDMVRDWSAPAHLNPVTHLFEPHMTMQANVTPVYGFFNGKSKFYQFGDPAVPGPDGRVLMAGPIGSVNDPGAKIHALKWHQGIQPMDPETRRLLPLKIGIFFQTGDVAAAIAQGAAAVGWPYNGHTFVATERYMGLYHEVAPKEQALTCSSCHGGTRMDFAALGYKPLATRNGAPLCQSCHGFKTADFYKIHRVHVADKKLDCSNCHTFSKAN